MSKFRFNKKHVKKAISCTVLSAVLAACSLPLCAAPALAARDSEALIDPDREGTLVIHKMIDNDGTLKDADGLVISNDYIPVDNIGFAYVRIADFDTVSGIVISDGGVIDLSTAEGMVSTGNYFRAAGALKELFDAAGVIPEPVYIKTGISGKSKTLQQEYAQNVSYSLLKEEQQAVTEAGAALKLAKDRLDSARQSYSKGVSASNAAVSAKDYAENVLTRARQSRQEAQSTYENAADMFQAAADAHAAASAAHEEALSALERAEQAFNNALKNYKEKASSELEHASESYKESLNAVKSASEKQIAAENNAKDAAATWALADSALKAAKDILDNVKSLIPANGSAISEDGVSNALKYAQEQYDNALRYYTDAGKRDEEAKQRSAEAETVLATAKEGLKSAEESLTEAVAESETAYAHYAEALRTLSEAQNRLNVDTKLQKEAYERQRELSSRLSYAREALVLAKTTAEEAQRAYEEAAEGNNLQYADTEALREAKEYAEAEYGRARDDYELKVSILDKKASDNGIEKLYITESLEAAMQNVITTLGEERITSWIRNTGDGHEGYTDDRGIVTFSGLKTGLYMVAETDISYHDGYAGAWNDGVSGKINNSSSNTYDAYGYHITPIDGWDQEEVHTYNKGELYRESVNPEYPVIETPAAPFMVSLPTTNISDSAGKVADGDLDGEAGTVWQYTIDVYPKNQTTAIYKRIVDPDEIAGGETLRTSEDYQIGDVIDQIIWADAPVLQKNYLYGSDTEDHSFGKTENEHLGYVISDTMTKGLTFERVTSVSIIPKRQIEGREPASVEVFGIVKDAEPDEGIELVEQIDYRVVNTNDQQIDLTDSEGNVATVIERMTSDDHHGFAVVLTDEGLNKLNNRTSDSVVTVRFRSVLNKNARIGQVAENMNYPSLFWINTNTSFRQIRGNEVYDYTYELQLQKKGVTDGREVSFIVRREDMDIKDGDLAQAKEKDLTDNVSERQFYGEDDSMRFVAESEGVYHVWGYISGDNTDEGDIQDGYETTYVNGVICNTVTPSADGKLIIKGLDSNDYIFKEIRTEAGRNLLKDTFTVSIRAADDASQSLRDGRILTARVSSGGSGCDITIGAEGVTDGQDKSGLITANKGIASMEIENFSAVHLRTGGAGKLLFYIAGTAAAGLALLSVVRSRRKKRC